MPNLRTAPIYTDNPGSLPAQYVIPGTLELILQAVVARFDGASAASSFIACLSLYTQDGRLIARTRPDQTFAVGDTGVVTYAPFMRSERTQAAVGARIENLAGQSVSNNVDTTRVFNTVTFDSGGMVDLSADPSKITIVTAGVYVIVSMVAYAVNATGRRNVLIYQNGYYGAGTGTNIGSVSVPANTEAGARTVSLSVTLTELASGEFITGGTHQTSGGSLTEGGAGTGSGSFLACSRIGA